MWIWILLSCTIIQTGTCHKSPDTNHSVTFTPREGKGWGWDSDKSTFFDVALTALAFLSFGVFLLNLLLNALLFPTSATTALTQPAGPILTMITSGSTGGAIVTGTGLGRRFKRSRRRRQLFSPEVDQTTAARMLLRFVTTSIESMAQKHECLPKIICEGSRQANVLGGRYQKIFTAISGSISCIGKLLGLHDDLPSHFNAMLLGSRNRNCQSAFPSCKKSL